MDAFGRGWRLLLSGAAVAALIVACGARTSGTAIGVSDRPAGGVVRVTPARDAGARDAAAALPPAYRSTFTKLNAKRFVSQGHAAGRWESEVWANGPGREALATGSRDVAPGALIVEEHYERGDKGEGRPPGPIMVLEKRERGYAPEHGDWRAAVIGSSGELLRDGVVEQCWGCHDDAPADGLFPVSP